MAEKVPTTYYTVVGDRLTAIHEQHLRLAEFSFIKANTV